MSKITYLLLLGTFLAVGAITYNMYQPLNIEEKKIDVPVVNKMKDWNKLKINKPESAFYFFFKAYEAKDSIIFCKNLIRKTQVGLAPGIAFGKTGDNFLRLCFAADVKFLENILNRLEEEFN